MCWVPVDATACLQDSIPVELRIHREEEGFNATSVYSIVVCVWCVVTWWRNLSWLILPYWICVMRRGFWLSQMQTHTKLTVVCERMQLLIFYIFAIALTFYTTIHYGSSPVIDIVDKNPYDVITEDQWWLVHQGVIVAGNIWAEVN